MQAIIAAKDIGIKVVKNIEMSQQKPRTLQIPPSIGHGW
jgi:hypothetical protein